MGYRPIEPNSLRGRPENDSVLHRLAVDAEPGGDESPYAIDGFVLHTHPDLCERLLTISAEVRGASAVGVYGLACLVDADGIVRTVARGTSGLWVRLSADDRARLVTEDDPESSEFGPEWLRIDAWQTVRPFAEGTARLKDLIGAAFGVAAGDEATDA